MQIFYDFSMSCHFVLTCSFRRKDVFFLKFMSNSEKYNKQYKFLVSLIDSSVPFVAECVKMTDHDRLKFNLLWHVKLTARYFQMDSGLLNYKKKKK